MAEEESRTLMLLGHAIESGIANGRGEYNYTDVGDMASKLHQNGSIDAGLLRQLNAIADISSHSKKLSPAIDLLPTWLMTPVKKLLKKNGISY